MKTTLVFGVALALSLIMTPIARRLAIRMGFVSQPIDRSIHTEPKPFLGGLAIYLAFAAAVLLDGQPLDSQVVGILVGGGLIVLLGIVDDRVALSPKVKLLGQVAAAAVLVYGFHVKMDHIYLGSRMISFGIFGGPLTIFWIVAFVNVVNLIDGLDGLAAGISGIASITLMLVSIQQQGNNTSAIPLTAALAGSAIGFLRYNFNPAKIFMGDAGAMFLGYALAAVSVHGVLKTTLAVGVFVPVLALALPIFDTAFAIIRRMTTGRSIGQADKDHLHHRLLRLGFSHRNTVLVMWAISAWLGLSAVAISELPLTQGLLLIGVVFVVMVVGAKKMGLLAVHAPNQKSMER